MVCYSSLSVDFWCNIRGLLDDPFSKHFEFDVTIFIYTIYRFLYCIWKNSSTHTHNIIHIYMYRNKFVKLFFHVVFF